MAHLGIPYMNNTVPWISSALLFTNHFHNSFYPLSRWRVFSELTDTWDNLTNNSHSIYQNPLFCLHSPILLAIFLCNQILFIFIHYDSEASHFKQYPLNTNVGIPPQADFVLTHTSPPIPVFSLLHGFGFTSPPTINIHFTTYFTGFSLHSICL